MPKKMLADLIRQGFRLAVCGNSIEVAPRSQLTESVRQDIQKHKGELMALLRTEGPPEDRVLAPGKTRRRVPGQKSSVRPKDGDVCPAPKLEVGASMPMCNQETSPTATQHATRPVPATEPIMVPTRTPKPIHQPKRLAPLLCPSCRRLGYANCQKCVLATDSSLALDGGVIFGVRLPTAQDLWRWHRCKRCDNCFKAPQYPALSLCPDCVAQDARQPAQHPSGGEP
jgi:hypothetical protein